ncbi:MAG TPA: tetratricopeptide repeat protein [Longimicrobiales bacterium]|nr:tetratricopeptide repeat protein [Longimicrobiales bacterium]
MVKARELRDSGRYRESIQLLENYLRRAPADYNAELILAEAYYWSGDFSAASKHFRGVLSHDPNNAAAKRQLDEIRATMRPLYDLSVNYAHDNQPTDRTFATAGFRYFFRPALSARIQLTGEHATAGSVALDRIDPAISFKAGIAKGLFIEAAFERPRYSATILSLTKPVYATTTRLALQLDRKNWLGEAAVQHVGYDDDNTALTAYAWLLAPVMHSNDAIVQLGYAFGWNDAAESRFASTGRYDPYFTPENEMVHSVAASVSTWTKSGVRFQVNGSYGIKADRDAPAIQGQGQNRTIRFTGESFQPYQAHAGVTFPLSRRASLTIDGEHTKTAFYKYNRAGVSTSFR